MKQISNYILVVLILSIITLLIVTISSAQTDEIGVVSISVDNFQLDIQHIRTITDSDITYLVLEILLWNRHPSAVEFTSDDFPAHLNNLDLQHDKMKEIRDQYYEGWNYPGSENGQLIDSNRSDKSLLVYVVPESPSSITLEFNPENSQSKFTLWLEPLENGDYRFGLESVEVGMGQVATYTPGPTVSGTVWYIANAQNVNARECASADCKIVEIMPYGAAVIVSVPSDSGWQLVTLPDRKQGYINVNYLQQELPPSASPTLPPTQKPSLGTRYATSTMNLRACAGAECSIVGSLTFGEAFEITGTRRASDGTIWYSLERDHQEMWAAGWLTSRSRPFAPVQQPAPQQPTAQPTIQNWNCSGNFYDCNNFSSCSDMWSYWNACPGDPSHLDGEDNDGRPCEIMCG